MGALTSNRKRGDDSFSIPFDQSYDHFSKKLKLSVPVNRNAPEMVRASSSKSAVSIITQYPDSKRGFSREVRSPVRNSRFESNVSAQSTDSYRVIPANKIGGLKIYERIKRAALKIKATNYAVTGRQGEKGKEVIVLDSEDEGGEGVSNGASLEELENVEKWEGEKGAVENLQGKELRCVDSSDVSNALAKNGDMEMYMRLYDSSKKRDGKLTNIKFDVEIQQLHLSKNVAEECFVPLTVEEKEDIFCAFSTSNRRKLMIAHPNSFIDITGEKLQCLKPGAWVNDEVINLYFELLKERERREPEKFLKCHFFNTFFYKKLISGRGGYNFQSVRRWTSQKKLGYSLLECDKIFVPIHKEVHWCLAVINKKEKKFQ